MKRETALNGYPALFTDLDFAHFYLQPMDGPDLAHNTRLTVEYCLAHPQWRLSLQTHKLLDIRRAAGRGRRW